MIKPHDKVFANLSEQRHRDLPQEPPTRVVNLAKGERLKNFSLLTRPQFRIKGGVSKEEPVDFLKICGLRRSIRIFRPWE